MPKRERAVCGPYLPGTAPTERNAESGSDEANEDDDADTTYPYDRRRFVALPAWPERSSPYILFYRRQFPVYPEGAPAEAWDMLRLHLGHIVQQAAFDLNLPIYAVAAAVSAFHTVFPGHFTREELCTSPHIVSRCMAACLFLAGKTSETNLKLREAVNCIDFLQWKLQQQHRRNAAAAASGGLQQQQQQELSKSTVKTEATKEADGQDTVKSASPLSSSSQRPGAEKQRKTTEHRYGEGSGNRAPSAVEGEDKTATEGNRPLSEAGRKNDANASTEGTKSGARVDKSAEDPAQKDGSSAGAGRCDSQRSENSSRPRIIGVASFSRASQYLKGYVPMGIREYWHVRQECLREEERLLQALGFSLPLPYLYDVLLEALLLVLPTHEEAHLIWSIVNDVAATPLLDHFSPPVLIAAAALCAKKFLAVATSFGPAQNRGIQTTVASGTSTRPISILGKTPRYASAAATTQEPSPGPRGADAQTDKLCPTGDEENSSLAVTATLKEAPQGCLSLLTCKSEPKGGADRNTGPPSSVPIAAVRKTAQKTKQEKEEVNEKSTVGSAARPDAACSGPIFSWGKQDYTAEKEEQGLLEVLERLDPLLCGSPEYWVLCKGHERRGLERGGSRWARALPPASMAWSAISPPDSAARGVHCTGSAADADESFRLDCSASICGADKSVNLHELRAETNETGRAVGDSCAASESETEEDEERRRLLKERKEDQRQRRLIYVQVAEACARLMEVYSLLLKSQRVQSCRSRPPT